MSAKLPRLAGLGLPSRKVVTAAHPAIPEHPKSKFFFDMLMSLDHDIIGQYIMPHVMPAGANSQGGVRWLSAMYEVSLSCGRPGKEEKDEGGGGEEEKDEGAGFMKRNIFHSFVMPSIEAAPPSWRYVTTNLSDYIMFGKIKSKEMLRGIVKAVHGNHGSIGLCMDFVQCGGCSWAIYGNTGQGCERVSTVNIVWDCDNYAKFLVREADGFAEARVNLRRIKLTGMDVCTHIGRTLCDSAREVVSKMGTPMCLVLKNTITNESGLDKVCKLISDCCMRRCTTVVVDEFVFMGRADREGMQPQILEAMSSSSSSRVSSSSPVTKLVIAGCSMPIGRLDSMRCAMAILKLPSLDNLEINTKHPVGRGFDSTAQLLKGFGFCMYESDKNIFHSLRKLTLSFGDSSFTSSRVIVAHDPQGVTHVDIVDNPSVSDDGSSSSGGEEEEEPVGDAVVTVPYRDDPDLAFCISHVNAPFLEVSRLVHANSLLQTP